MSSSAWVGLIVGIMAAFTSTIGLIVRLLYAANTRLDKALEDKDALADKFMDKMDKMLPALEANAQTFRTVAETLTRATEALAVHNDRRSPR